jgi:putative FmdB family regulatory protein
MPTYEYRCPKCEKAFSVVMHITEHDQSKVKCPSCGSGEVVQQYSTFYAKTSKKS